MGGLVVVGLKINGLSDLLNISLWDYFVCVFRMECPGENRPDQVAAEELSHGRAENQKKSPKRRRDTRRCRRRANGADRACPGGEPGGRAESRDVSETGESSTKKLDKCR